MREQVTYPYVGGTDAEAYEYLNRCSDPDGRLEELMWSLAPIDGAVLLDVGAGSGYHAVRYAKRAAHVYALEPDRRLLQQMHARLTQLPVGNVSVLATGAESIPLQDGCIDIVHARFAYFFGDNACLPGLLEVERVLKPEGHLFVVDVDPDDGGLPALARWAYPQIFHATYSADHDSFYRSRGFAVHRVRSVFRAPSRAVLQAVFQMDFPHCYGELLNRVQGTELNYTFTLYHYHARSAQ